MMLREYHSKLPAIQPAPMQAWAGTSRKARDALRRGSLEVVHALEARILREVGTRLSERHNIGIGSWNGACVTTMCNRQQDKSQPPAAGPWLPATAAGSHHLHRTGNHPKNP
jgi:hypothetical protein